MAGTDLVVNVGSDISGFKSGMGGLPGIAKVAFAGVVAAAAAASAAIYKASKVGSEFQQTLTETTTVAQAFGKDLKALENKARELGKTTAFTATEAARGMYNLASAGMDTKQIVDSVEHAMMLAGATGSDLTQATQVLAASLKQFGLDASESRRITDTFAAAITNSLLTMDRLTEGMKYAGTTGAALGWSIEETTAALAQFVNLGLEGSQAGTNLRMAMSQLVKQTDKAKKALRQMGVTFEEINPEAHSFGEILRVLGEASINTEQALALFGQRAALNMKQLAKGVATGKTNFDELLKVILESQKGIGRTAEMYNRMMNTFQKQWEIVVSAMIDLGIEFFNTFSSESESVFTDMAKHINNFSKTLNENSEGINAFFNEIAIGLRAINSIADFVGSNLLKVINKYLKLRDTVGKTIREFFKENLNFKIDPGPIKETQKSIEDFDSAVQNFGDSAVDVQEAWGNTFFAIDKTTKVIVSDLEKINQAWNDYINDINIDDPKLRKIIEELDRELQELAQSATLANRNLSDPINFDVDYGPIDQISAKMHELTQATDAARAAAYNYFDYDYDYGKLSDGLEGIKKAYVAVQEGAENAFKQAREDFITWEQVGKQAMEGLVDSAQNLMGDVFYDIMTGKFDSISDAFSSFFDSILRKWTDMLGEMAANKLMDAIGVENLLGIGLSGALGYAGANMLGFGQSTQVGAGVGGALGYWAAGKYFPNMWSGYGGLMGMVAGGLLGSLFGGGSKAKQPIYKEGGGYAWAMPPVSDPWSREFTASKWTAWGDTFANQMIATFNDAQQKVADALTTTFQSIPPELYASIVRTGQIYRQIPQIYVSPQGGMSEGEYQRHIEQQIERLMSASQSYLDNIARAHNHATWEEFEKYMVKFETAAQTSAGLIAQAFNTAFEDTEGFTFENFKNTLYDTIFDTVKTSMINAFMQSEAFRHALQPFFMQFQKAIDEATVNGLFQPELFEQQLDDNLRFSILSNRIERLAPIVDLMANILGDIGTNFAYYSSRAEGGSVSAGKAYLVGEERPEVFVPDTDGYIYPNTSNYNQNGSIVFINNGTITEAEFFAKAMRQYQDYRQGDILEVSPISERGLRL